MTILLLGELHLTPIHGVLQLRPSFEYLNKGEANVRQASNLTEEGTQSESFTTNIKDADCLQPKYKCVMQRILINANVVS